MVPSNLGQFNCNVCESALCGRRQVDGEIIGCAGCDWWLSVDDFLGEVSQQAKDDLAHAIAEGWTRNPGFSASIPAKRIYRFRIKHEPPHQAEDSEEG